MRKIAAVALKTVATTLLVIVVVFVAVGIIMGPGDHEGYVDAQAEISEAAAQSEGETEAPSEDEPQPQVFESGTARVEYRGAQDLEGNVVLSFMVTNLSDRTCLFGAENAVMNDEFNIQMLGGAVSLSGIEPGKSGAVSFTFGYATQTTVEDFAGVRTLAFDLVQHDAENLIEQVGMTPVSIEV